VNHGTTICKYILSFLLTKQYGQTFFLAQTCIYCQYMLAGYLVYEILHAAAEGRSAVDHYYNGIDHCQYGKFPGKRVHLYLLVPEKAGG
jgi:hypothetical protein